MATTSQTRGMCYECSEDEEESTDDKVHEQSSSSSPVARWRETASTQSATASQLCGSTRHSTPRATRRPSKASSAHRLTAASRTTRVRPCVRTRPRRTASRRTGAAASGRIAVGTSLIPLNTDHTKACTRASSPSPARRAAKATETTPTPEPAARWARRATAARIT